MNWLQGQTQWLWAAPLIGAVVAAWRQIRTFWAYIYESVVGQEEMEDASLAFALNWYLLKHGRPLLVRRFSYSALYRQVISAGRSELVAYRALPIKGCFLWVDGCLLYVSRSSSDATPGDRHNPEYARMRCSITYLRGWFDIETFIRRAVREFNQRTAEELNVGSGGVQISHRWGSVGSSMSVEAFRQAADESAPRARGGIVRSASEAMTSELANGEIFTHDLSDLGFAVPGDTDAERYVWEGPAAALAEEFQEWLAAKDWYDKRALVHRRGWALLGPPGTGKTSAIRELARLHGLPIVVMHLATMTDKELMDNWAHAMRSLPVIIVFEDIDTVFDGNQTIEGCKLKFTSFLNALDGVAVYGGVATFITTNYPEKLDPALAGAGEATRPGRIDSVITFDGLSLAGKRRIVERLLVDEPHLHEQLLQEGAADSPAQFQNRCIKVALQQFRKLSGDDTQGVVYRGNFSQSESDDRGSVDSEVRSASTEEAASTTGR